MNPTKVLTIISGCTVDEQECDCESEEKIVGNKYNYFKIDELKHAGVDANVFVVRESRLNYNEFEKERSWYDNILNVI